MMYPKNVNFQGVVTAIKIESETCIKCQGKKFIWTTDNSILDGY